jgi:hypothetical protein
VAGICTRGGANSKRGLAGHTASHAPEGQRAAMHNACDVQLVCQPTKALETNIDKINGQVPKLERHRKGGTNAGAILEQGRWNNHTNKRTNRQPNTLGGHTKCNNKIKDVSNFQKYNLQQFKCSEGSRTSDFDPTEPKQHPADKVQLGTARKMYCVNAQGVNFENLRSCEK